MPDLVVPRSKLIGMKVYTSTAEYVGEVRDIGFSLGGGQEVHLIVSTRAGTTVEIPFARIAAIGDIILLEQGYQPSPAPTTTAPSSGEPRGEPVVPKCPRCGHALIYYPKKKKWYCPSCKKYVKPSPPGVEKRSPRCPYCGTPLSYIEEYGKWYCYGCGRYVDV